MPTPTDRELEELKALAQDLSWRLADTRSLQASVALAKLLSSYEERGRALEPFARITPSSLHPADGSDAEPYYVTLDRPWHTDRHDFTGADLARARAALSPTPGGGE